MHFIDHLRMRRFRRRREYLRICVLTLTLGGLSTLLGGCLLYDMPPEPVISTDRTHGHAPLLVHLNAGGSIDSDGFVVDYQWTFGDGKTGGGVSVEHNYTVCGDYAVTLTVTDDDGKRASTTLQVSVDRQNVPPEASFAVFPACCHTDELVLFDASSSADTDGLIASYLWDFGDGSIGEGEGVSHSYSEPGTYHVTLTVTDDDGDQGERHEIVEVLGSNLPPIAQFEISPAKPAPEQTILFSAGSSYDIDGRIIRYNWSFGDGAGGQGKTASHSYRAAQSYSVTLEVEDDGGAVGRRSATVEIVERSENPEPGDTSTRIYFWSYKGERQQLEVSIPEPLYDHYRQIPRDSWPFRDYDEYVLDPLDDELLDGISQEITAPFAGDYYEMAENSLYFVQRVIAYRSDPGGFEYPKYPVETLMDEGGDCEDSSILYASIIRTLGHGALLVGVDTDGDGRADHMMVFVPLDETTIERLPCEYRIWEYRSRPYAIAETAIDGGYIPLGADPWGLPAEAIDRVWDVSSIDFSPQVSVRTLAR